ncbi:Hypothetical predicted protein [Olea europaea subsp. europaea]|uniref:Uncharacterized protein n=1 Tax=Olea europaea subsp. europaea TaxID=158383 RepID=A0A8S0TRJ2_OLEEU|nr:Hypothetical predicted protein [Olea europaea subsp. europaea]
MPGMSLGIKPYGDSLENVEPLSPLPASARIDRAGAVHSTRCLNRRTSSGFEEREKREGRYDTASLRRLQVASLRLWYSKVERLLVRWRREWFLDSSYTAQLQRWTFQALEKTRQEPHLWLRQLAFENEKALSSSTSTSVRSLILKEVLLHDCWVIKADEDPHEKHFGLQFHF